MAERKETETIDKLYLELSQFTTAKTNRELSLEQALRSAGLALEECILALDVRYDANIAVTTSTQAREALRGVRHVLGPSFDVRSLSVEGYCMCGTDSIGADGQHCTRCGKIVPGRGA